MPTNNAKKKTVLQNGVTLEPTVAPNVRKRTMPSGTVRYDAVVYAGRGLPPKRRSCTTLKEAREWVDELRTQKKKNQGRLLTERRLLSAYLTQWLADKANGMVRKRVRTKTASRPAPRTMADYQKLLHDWILEPKQADLRWLRERRVDRISHDDLTAFYRTMAAHTTPGRIEKLNKLLGQAFATFAIGGIPNPADDALLPAPETDPDDDAGDCAAKALNEDQARAVLQAARGLADGQEAAGLAVIPERCYSALWHVLLYAGLRPGEALALQWEDVSDLGQVVRVRHDLVRIRGQQGYELGKPKTAKGRRAVRLEDVAWAELMAWKKLQKQQRALAGAAWTEREHHFVFTCSTGVPLYPHGVRRAWVRVCARAGVGEWGPEPERQHVSGPLPKRPFTPSHRVYDCRHTCCTLMLMNGVPVNVVADILGHANGAFTIARYGHALPKETAAATRTLGAVLTRSA